MTMQYCIKSDYIHRKEIEGGPLLDNCMSGKDEAQNEVYKIASIIANLHNLNKIMDIGCGSGFKLLKYFKNKDTVGIDIPEVVENLKELYRDRKWLNSDFRGEWIGKIDLVICSDVIEHLIDPDELLTFVKRVNPRFFIVSTPNRDTIDPVKYPTSQSGPPMNKWHVREWSFQEFNDYISKTFKILSHCNTEQGDYSYQTIICR